MSLAEQYCLRCEAPCDVVRQGGHVAARCASCGYLRWIDEDDRGVGL